MPLPKKNILSLLQILTGITLLGAISYVKEYTSLIFVNLLHWSQPTYFMAFVITGCLVLIFFGIKHLIHWDQDTKSPFSENRKVQARTSYLTNIGFFIKNRLDNSIQKATYIHLHFKDSSEKIESLQFIHRDQDGKEKIITSLYKMLEDKPFKILLLGGPGSGKTTTIYHHLKEFIELAKENDNRPVPLYVNLADWGKSDNSRRSKVENQRTSYYEDQTDIPSDFEIWIAKTVSSQKNFNVPEGILIQWLVQENVHLFLDGLDEANETNRAELINCINMFLEVRPGISLIICSRTADYEALVNLEASKLNLNHAVTILPYSDNQLRRYLESMPLPKLRDFITSDDALVEMAHSPLEL